MDSILHLRLVWLIFLIFIMYNIFRFGILSDIWKIASFSIYALFELPLKLSGLKWDFRIEDTLDKKGQACSTCVFARRPKAPGKSTTDAGENFEY